MNIFEKAKKAADKKYKHLDESTGLSEGVRNLCKDVYAQGYSSALSELWVQIDVTNLPTIEVLAIDKKSGNIAIDYLYVDDMKYARTANTDFVPTHYIECSTLHDLLIK